MTIFSVAASIPLLPDPDENSRPIATIDPSDVVAVEKALDPWSKVSLTKTGVSVAGWVVSANLIPIQEATVRLFDEPLGSLIQSMTGRIDIITTVATWAKVKVTKQDGSQPAIGWTEDATRPPAPATSTADAGSATKLAEPSKDATLDEGNDLVLGPNERYRKALLQAETITKINAAALAALIDAEAARIRSGPDAGAWDPKSSAGEASSARGLTQFLDSTWRTMACTAGTFLNNAAKKKGCVTANDRIAPNMDDILLDMRFDPTTSIITAAEYGFSNLKALEAAKLVDSDIDEDDSAWYIYLAHHEGLDGAEHFLRNDEAVPLSKLVAQVGDQTRANQLVAAAGNNVTIAYRKWLTDYMEQKIQPSRFRLAKAPAAKVIAQSARALGQFAGPPIALATMGDRPDLALEIQQILTNLGYLDPPPDGFMGPTSQWALAEFCKLNGLSLDGGFTKEIAGALLNPKQFLPEIRSSGSWIDFVLAYMKKKNYFICRHPACKNIIYVEGVDLDGKCNQQTPNVFGDLRVVLSICTDGAPIIHDWVSTTEPGQFYTMHPMNPKGAARIAFGQYKSWHVGIHVGPTGFDPHEALIQAAPIDVYRDSNKDFKREGPTYTGIFGVDQHWGYDQPKNDVGRASAGCLVGEMRDGHRAFMALVKSDPRYAANNGYNFMTTIIPGAEALADTIA